MKRFSVLLTYSTTTTEIKQFRRLGTEFGILFYFRLLFQLWCSVLIDFLSNTVVLTLCFC